MLKKNKKNIEGFCSGILAALNTKIQLEGENFRNIVEQLKITKTDIDKIITQWDNAYKIYGSLENYQTYNDSLKERQTNIDTTIKDIESMDKKDYHLITTKSFLVCRCGGVISVKDSGQGYEKIVDNLITSILRIITEFKEHCSDTMEENPPQNENDADPKWNSYKVEKGLVCFENMLVENGGKTDPDVCIYLELTCHSYKEEVEETMLSVLSLITLFPGTGALGIALAFYAAVMVEERLLFRPTSYIRL